jgi:hypothetical protein
MLSNKDVNKNRMKNKIWPSNTKECIKVGERGRGGVIGENRA